ncbi:unnamed protein product [Caenorhabditis auriculariae]|uniref:Uncharacterized protein n=1 Tax=Caenorhabditis auriculariae TaxID=2777116 RepID=A0A8S1GW00_9PELO|nr:unnamed protein product [Caenorhabditis auriculariae]
MHVHENGHLPLPQLSEQQAGKEMWLVVLCFVLPAVVFSLFALLAWLRVLHQNHERKKRATTASNGNERLVTKRNGEVVCNIPIQVIDVDTGATFFYASDDSLSGRPKPEKAKTFKDSSLISVGKEKEAMIA